MYSFILFFSIFTVFWQSRHLEPSALRVLFENLSPQSLTSPWGMCKEVGRYFKKFPFLFGVVEMQKKKLALTLLVYPKAANKLK